MTIGTYRNVLSNVTAGDLSTDPFTHVVTHPALPMDSYERLQQCFPTMEDILGQPSSSSENAAARLSAKQVLGNPNTAPEWREFFAAHVSGSFWADIIRVFGDKIRTTYPNLEERVGRPLEEFSVGMRGTKDKADIKLECQFVINTPSSCASSVKTPHIDKRETLFAGLLYFRQDTDMADGGDLELYRWKTEPRFLTYRMILPGDVEPVGRIPYSANTLICFLNSNQSVHGVTPRQPSILPRRYINLIAEFPFHIFKTRDAGLYARLANWPQRKEVRRKQARPQHY